MGADDDTCVTRKDRGRERNVSAFFAEERARIFIRARKTHLFGTRGKYSWDEVVGSREWK